MKITVNGKERVTEARTMAELCRELGLAAAKIATARNGKFVPAPERSAARLNDGDEVELLSPRQGG